MNELRLNKFKTLLFLAKDHVGKSNFLCSYDKKYPFLYFGNFFSKGVEITLTDFEENGRFVLNSTFKNGKFSVLI